GDVVERVSSFKLLGLTNNLSWDIHVDKISKKADSRIYALRLLKKAGLSPLNIVHIYCAVIRSQLEYASPVWSALPKTLSDLIESVQKSALKIAYPTLSYDEALRK
ncbi:RNA-directed DNA polymerase from mobile element jockey, partial [Paramuricea clavata]